MTYLEFLKDLKTLTIEQANIKYYFISRKVLLFLYKKIHELH